MLLSLCSQIATCKTSSLIHLSRVDTIAFIVSIIIHLERNMIRLFKKKHILIEKRFWLKIWTLLWFTKHDSASSRSETLNYLKKKHLRRNKKWEKKSINNNVLNEVATKL